MYMCIYICVCVCICTYICIYMCMYVCIYMYICVHMYIIYTCLSFPQSPPPVLDYTSLLYFSFFFPKLVPQPPLLPSWPPVISHNSTSARFLSHVAASVPATSLGAISDYICFGIFICNFHQYLCKYSHYYSSVFIFRLFSFGLHFNTC